MANRAFNVEAVQRLVSRETSGHRITYGFVRRSVGASRSGGQGQARRQPSLLTRGSKRLKTGGSTARKGGRICPRVTLASSDAVDKDLNSKDSKSMGVDADRTSSTLVNVEPDSGRSENEFSSSGFIGATALIAGGCVGGGILALPQATAEAGFIPVTFASLGVWGFLYLQGLLLVEVNQAVCNKGGRDSSTILSMGKETLGQPVGRAMAFAYFLYANFVLVGQFSKGGSLLVLEGFHDSVESLSYGSFHYTITTLTIVGFVSVIVYLGGGDLAERTNRWLTFMLLIAFGILVFVGSGEANWSNLLIANWTQLPSTIPTLFQVLCFGGVIPVACACIDRSEIKSMRNSVFLGSFIPLLMVITWNGIAVALAPPPGTILEDSGAQALKDPINLLLSTHETGLLPFVVSSFSFSAVMTTVIGLLLALTEFVEESLVAACEEHENNQTSGTLAKSSGVGGTRWVMAAVVNAAGLGSNQRSESGVKILTKTDKRKRLKRAARYITLLPSAVMASLGPSMFYSAIHINGSYVVPFLFCIAPPLMTMAVRGNDTPALLKSRSDFELTSNDTNEAANVYEVPELVPGGSKVLWTLFGMGCVIVIAQLTMDLPELFVSNVM